MIAELYEGGEVPEGRVMVEAAFSTLNALRVDLLNSETKETMPYVVIRDITSDQTESQRIVKEATNATGFNLWYQLCPGGMTLVDDTESVTSLEIALRAFDAAKVVH